MEKTLQEVVCERLTLYGVLREGETVVRLPDYYDRYSFTSAIRGLKERGIETQTTDAEAKFSRGEETYSLQITSKK